jgi:hypothetical protein
MIGRGPLILMQELGTTCTPSRKPAPSHATGVNGIDRAPAAWETDSTPIMDDRAAKMDPSGLIGIVCLDLDF